jgi:hypothetical protein
MSFEEKYLKRILGSVSDLDQDSLFSSTGDGDPSCADCSGKGHVDVSLEKGFPSSKRCLCALKKDVIQNLERAWKGLSEAPPLSDSPLKPLTKKNVWVTSTANLFRQHLRHVGFRKPSNWYLKVIADSQISTAWFANVALKGEEILDVDAAAMSLEYVSIPDLVLPPELLVIRLGVKTARMSAMSEVLMEALTLREHQNLPTWIFDQPYAQLSSPDHLCYSIHLMEYLADWPRVNLEATSTNTSPKPTVSFEMPMPGPIQSVKPRTTSTKEVTSRFQLKKGPNKK